MSSAEQILSNFHTALVRIEGRKVRIKARYSEVSALETANVVRAAWMSAEPDFRHCMASETITLAEELRVLTSAAEYIRSVEIPNLERLIEADRKHDARLAEIDQEFPAATEVVN